MPIVVTPGAPAPTTATDATTYNGSLRAVVDPVHAGVEVFCDFSAYLAPGYGFDFPTPFVATVYRIAPDGSTLIVRSGDRVVSYGGIFAVYDDEVPMGQVVGYYAIPELSDGTPGPTTGTAAVQTWEPDGGFTSPGVWLKCLDNPDLSMPVRVQDWSSGTYDTGAVSAALLGSPFPAVAFDVRKGYVSQLTVLTASEDEYQQLLAATAQGSAYLVGLERHRRRTGYYVIGGIGPTRLGPVDSSYDAWTIPIVQIARPQTSGQTVVFPGKSFTDREAAYPFFSDIGSTDPAVQIAPVASTMAQIGTATGHSVPVQLGTDYTGMFRMRYVSGPAALVMHASLLCQDASGGAYGYIRGDSYTVQPGDDVIIRVNGYSSAAAQIRTFVQFDNTAGTEVIQMLSAALFEGDTPTGPNLFTGDTAEPESSVGNWIGATDCTITHIARTGHSFRDNLEP